MTSAFPEAEVQGYQSLVESLEVSDPDDRHVLAAAIVARVDVIVTRNVRHFPPESVSRFDIEVQDPDTFLLRLFETFPDEVSGIVMRRADDLGDTVPETLGFLRQHVPRFIEALSSGDPFSC